MKSAQRRRKHALRAGCSKADPQTNTQTHKQTGAITIHCAA